MARGPLAAKLTRRGLLVGALAGASLALFPARAARASDGTVSIDGLRIRDDLWGSVITSLSAGAWVRINAYSRDQGGAPWYYVTTENGTLGWVSGKFVDVTPTAWARVGVQAGHWRYQEAGYPLNTEPGGRAAGWTELDVNLTIAEILSRRLSARGIAVDLLPTEIPDGYSADAVVAIHADVGPGGVRGFFVDRAPRSPIASAEASLARIVTMSHSYWTGIPYVPRPTANSSHYYGFRAVDPRTPMVLIEVGCLTNARDRAIIAGRPGLVADGLAGAIDQFVS